MADERVIAKKLEQIEQYHGELKEKQQSLSHEEFPKDTTEQRAVERMFENAIQACSDLAQHVATHDFDFEGDASKGAIRVLGQEGVIEGETVNTLVVLSASLVERRPRKNPRNRKGWTIPKSIGSVVMHRFFE